MNDSSNNLRGATEILNAIVEKLEALTLKPGNGAAFARVEIFDLADWKAAVRRLVLNNNRAALVIYAGDDFKHVRENSVLTVDRTTRIDVLLTDRLLGDTVRALTGDGSRPGTLGLLDALLPALTGTILDADEDQEDSVYLVPTGVERIFVTDEEKANWPGRSALLLSLEASAPWLQTAVGNQANF